MFISRSLSKDLTLYKNNCYPMVKRSSSRLRYHAIIGIGGNVGDTRRRFHKLLIVLKKLNGVELIATSAILKNPPFGYTKQNYFYNSVIEVKTSFEAKVFLRVLLHIEKLFSRKRSFKDAPRTLDLDLLFFDHRVIKSEFLMLPHPHWEQRESVTVPLKNLETDYFKVKKRVHIR